MAVQTPPPEAVAAILGASSRITRRCDIYEQDGITPFLLDAPIIDGSVAVDATRDERRSFTLVVDNADGEITTSPGGLWYDKVIKLYRGVEYSSGGEIVSWEAQLGEFLIDQIETQDFPNSIAINGRDLTKKAIEDEFATSITVGTGYSPLDLIVYIAASSGITRWSVESVDSLTERKFTFEAGTTKWAAMKAIAQAYNYEIFFDATGTLVARQYRDPVTSPTIFTFDVGATGSLANFKKRASSANLANHVVVTGEATDQLPIVASVENTEPSSPTSIDNLGYRRTYRYTSSFITSEAQAEALAASLLSVMALESYDLNMESLVLPWLEVSEIVGFNGDPLEGPDRFLLSTLDIPLKLGLMSSVGKRVMVVG